MAVNVSDREAWRHVERVEREAWSDMIRAAPADYAEKHGLAVRDLSSGTVQLSYRSLDIPQFDRAFGFGTDGPIVAADVDAIVDGYARAGIKGYYLQVAPAVEAELA